jgi:hypothetical protein
MSNYNGSSSDRRTLIKDILHVPLNKVWRGKGMLQEMRDSYAMKHASAYAMLHALVHEKRQRVKAP